MKKKTTACNSQRSNSEVTLLKNGVSKEKELLKCR